MGNIRIKPSASGIDYALSGDRRLNSSYDPRGEARKFIDRQIDGTPGTVVLSGCTLGYQVEYILQRYPETKILCFFFDPVLLAYCTKKLGDRMPPGMLVSGDTPSPVRGFLSGHIAESDLEGLVFLEWPPSVREYPVQGRCVRNTLSQTVREINGSLVTTRFFGKRWIFNTFRNFNTIETFIIPARRSSPVLVTGSGPSLSDSLKLIQSRRGRLFVLALSSSLRTLLSAGIQPDAVISTDPGFWASVLLRDLGDKSTPVLSPLSASLPHPAVETSPIVLLNQDTFFENSLLEHTRLPFLLIPPEGTVAATAVKAALELTCGPVITAGFDFCYRDIFLHARPHAFDLLDETASLRTDTLLSRVFRKAFDSSAETLPGGSRRSLPLKTYAGWFSRQIRPAASRVYRLLPSEVDIPGFIPLGTAEAAAFLDRTDNVSAVDRSPGQPLSPDHGERARVSRMILDGWMNALTVALQGEDLFFSPSGGTVADLCRTLAVEDLLQMKRLQRQGEHEKIEPVRQRMLTGIRATIEELRRTYERR